MTSWSKAVEDYVDMRRSLGFRLQEAKAGLIKFASFLEQQRAARITIRLAMEWAQQDKAARPVEWARRLTFVRGFARYWSAQDSQTEIPPCGLLPHRPGRAHPYLYSNDEICKLLQAARQMPSADGLRGLTYYCLLGLLTVTGLRISEARNLKTEDVDLHEGILTIRGTKFGKSRLVPIHSSNLCFIAGKTNRQISDKAPDKYFPEIIGKSGIGVFEAQCIPTDPSFLGIENFKAFLQQRRHLVTERINKFLGT